MTMSGLAQPSNTNLQSTSEGGSLVCMQQCLTPLKSGIFGLFNLLFNGQNVKSDFWTRNHNLQFAQSSYKDTNKYTKLHTPTGYQIDVKSKPMV